MDIETQKNYRYGKYFIFCLQIMQIIFLAMWTIQAPFFFFFANANQKNYFVLSETLCRRFRTSKNHLTTETRSAGTSRLEGLI